jgi:hypothetical protein
VRLHRRAHLLADPEADHDGHDAVDLQLAPLAELLGALHRQRVQSQPGGEPADDLLGGFSMSSQKGSPASTSCPTSGGVGSSTTSVPWSIQLRTVASANYSQGQPRRAAALDEPGDLMPVDVVRVGLSERLWNPEPLELRHPPFVDQVLVTLDGFVASDQLGWLHPSFLQPARSGDRPSCDREMRIAVPLLFAVTFGDRFPAAATC